MAAAGGSAHALSVDPDFFESSTKPSRFGFVAAEARAQAERVLAAQDEQLAQQELQLAEKEQTIKERAHMRRHASSQCMLRKVAGHELLAFCLGTGSQ